MSNIFVLDSQTIDKIAAGEVVERPVSVVKETVENAIDAGATAITVEIKGGGIDYIRITDNGIGIHEDDIRTAFLRHATSKIKSVEDLVCVTSLGFRGEALSSISAVAKVELLTKTADAFAGSRYVIEGGREMAFEAAGVPNGTTMIIRNLFYNVPARRKFLKSAMTEGSYISELMEHIMLSHPEISFKYIVNSNVKLQTSGDGNIETVIYHLYGRDVSSLMMPVAYEDQNLSIKGFVGRPEMARGNHNYEIYFVNSRNIRSTLINRALDEAFKPYLMLHKYPYAILYLTIAPSDLDVNVHPTKMEIRFLESERVYSAVVRCVSEALGKKDLIMDADEPDLKVAPVKPDEKAILPEPFETNRRQETYERTTSQPVAPTIAAAIAQEIPYHVDSKPEKTSVVATEDLSPVFTAPDFAPAPAVQYEQVSFLSEKARIKHNLIGQLFDTYLLVEYDGKLYIIDQHAAHEKIRYERLMASYLEKKCDVQMLNPPIIISLSLREEETLNRYMDLFSETGFEVEHFGGNEYAIYGVPAELYGMDEASYFVELLDILSDQKQKSEMDSVLAHLASISCKGAVKAGKRLSDREANVLIDELLNLEHPFHCPHGRPVIISFSRTELEKKFKRIL